MALLALGVWADATILCRRPLDDWIDEAAAPADGFFAFAPEKGASSHRDKQ